MSKEWSNFITNLYHLVILLGIVMTHIKVKEIHYKVRHFEKCFTEEVK